MSKAFVLLSGGIDSTTALWVARSSHEELVAVSVNYGQRHGKEMHYAKKQAELARAEQRVVSLPFTPKSALTDANGDIPNVTYDEIEGKSPSYVPFRNGMMLSMVAAMAAGEGAQAIYCGVHAEDAANWAYADCTLPFIGAMASAILIGTYNEVMLHAPFLAAEKHDIIRKGHNLGVDYSLTWSCYRGGEAHCGACPTCHARHQAFMRAGVSDPTEYEKAPRNW